MNADHGVMYRCAECGRLVAVDAFGNFVHEGGTETIAQCTYCGRQVHAERWELGSTCPRCLRGRLNRHHTVRPEEWDPWEDEVTPVTLPCRKCGKEWPANEIANVDPGQAGRIMDTLHAAFFPVFLNILLSRNPWSLHWKLYFEASRKTLEFAKFYLFTKRGCELFGSSHNIAERATDPSSDSDAMRNDSVSEAAHVWVEEREFDGQLNLLSAREEMRREPSAVIERRLERVGFEEMGHDLFVEEFARWHRKICESGRRVISAFRRKRSVGFDVAVICEG